MVTDVLLYEELLRDLTNEALLMGFHNLYMVTDVSFKTSYVIPQMRCFKDLTRYDN